MLIVSWSWCWQDDSLTLFQYLLNFCVAFVCLWSPKLPKCAFYMLVKDFCVSIWQYLVFFSKSTFEKILKQEIVKGSQDLLEIIKKSIELGECLLLIFICVF